MDPVTIALIARQTILTALQVRQIFTDTGMTAEEKEAKFAELLAEAKDNTRRKYSDYDPNLDRDLAASGG